MNMQKQGPADNIDSLVLEAKEIHQQLSQTRKKKQQTVLIKKLHNIFLKMSALRPDLDPNRK